MISGRGLGHTGGTVDKLESIVGFNIRLEDSKFYELMNKNSCFMACQTDDLAPADKKLYHIRDITGNVESTGLITASILSKKFVEDLDGLVLDMKVGNGAFMKTKEQAKELAESMANVAREVGLNMRIVFTAMDQPIGLKMGNWLEIEETIDALNGKCPEDLRILTEKLAVAMLLVGKVYNDETTALEAVRKVWDSKIALAKFYEMAEAQGGNIQESYARYSNYKRIDILAENAGFIESYNSYNFGLAGIMIGAGRKHIDDVLDFGAGIEIYQKVGDKVESGDKIATIITSRDNEYLDVIELIKSSIVISDIKPENLGSLILDEWIIN